MFSYKHFASTVSMFVEGLKEKKEKLDFEQVLFFDLAAHDRFVIRHRLNVRNRRAMDQQRPILAFPNAALDDVWHCS